MSPKMIFTFALPAIPSGRNLRSPAFWVPALDGESMKMPIWIMGGLAALIVATAGAFWFLRPEGVAAIERQWCRGMADRVPSWAFDIPGL